jgi:histidine ammonia-lyase
MTLAMIGEGSVDVDARRLSARAALAEAGLTPVALAAKEGLGMINGTQFSTAHALAGLFDAERLAEAALVTGALAVDALMGSTTPFHPEIQALRGHPGQIIAARRLRALLEGSQIRQWHIDDDNRIQDPYSFRCQPQVMGACLDLIATVRGTLTIEANAVTDNPLVLTASREFPSGGNFHAEPVAFAADQLALALAEIGAIVQRRIALLVDVNASNGLPAFLAGGTPGLNSGFMVAEIAAAALMAENKQRATPASIGSTPTSANQEDHVSMAAHGARRLADMTSTLSRLIGIEAVVAAQGITLRQQGIGWKRHASADPSKPDQIVRTRLPKGLATSPALERVMVVIRSRIPPLEGDRPLTADLEAGAELAITGRLAGATGLPSLVNETVI